VNTAQAKATDVNNRVIGLIERDHHGQDTDSGRDASTAWQGDGFSSPQFLIEDKLAEHVIVAFSMGGGERTRSPARTRNFASNMLEVAK
jgi:hypothetical protein